MIGLMSGTSMDAIDVAVLRTDGESLIEPGPSGEFVYQPSERQAVRASLRRPDPSAEAVEAVTAAHIRAIASFLQMHPDAARSVDLVGFHGQTTFHDPEKRLTVQIGDAQRIADHFGLPVVADFRTADVAAGGQGAPFAPLYHRALSAGIERPFCVLNLGGVGNVTWIGEGDAILAFDTGPANAQLDDLMLSRTGRSFDKDGQLARIGQPDMSVVESALRASYLSRVPPKSLDRNDFDVRPSEADSLENQLATLLEFVVETVAASREHFPEQPVGWVVTGGGRKNAYLMERLAARLEAPVEPAEAAGWNGDALEAQCFAWLAVRSERGLPLSLPETTGVPAPMPGGRTVQPAMLSARRRSTY
ncbi:MAG: anhydro-N-acetylmuramic acid kinase [Minwuia sp.]|uniref:anhydro-N-acetylmuramic acid kinase n=1 Tax=Minwuia sp. TaxID=2493630 RepID=UPI003A869022